MRSYRRATISLRTEKDQESKLVRELESELQSLSQQQQEALRRVQEQDSRALEIDEQREEEINARMQSLQEESKELEETLQSEITTLNEELTQCQQDMALSTNRLFNLRQQNSQMTERNPVISFSRFNRPMVSPVSINSLFLQKTLFTSFSK